MQKLGAMQDWPLRVMRLVDHAEREHGHSEIVSAWADGSIEPKEREAILRAAAEKGIAPDSIAGQVLNGWLTEPLGAELVSAWRRYIQTIWPSLTPRGMVTSIVAPSASRKGILAPLTASTRPISSR